LAAKNVHYSIIDALLYFALKYLGRTHVNPESQGIKDTPISIELARSRISRLKGTINSRDGRLLAAQLQ
jgi:hypothetical protein